MPRRKGEGLPEEVSRRFGLASKGRDQVTVEVFLNGIMSQQELWAEVGSMGLMDFANAVLASARKPKREQD